MASPMLDMEKFRLALVETSKLMLFRVGDPENDDGNMMMMVHLPDFITEEKIDDLFMECQRMRIGEQILNKEERKDIDTDDLEQKLAIAVNGTIAFNIGNKTQVPLEVWTQHIHVVASQVCDNIDVSRQSLNEKIFLKK